ncbi:MAG: ATP synthase F1 subunit delta [Bacteroidales bacterium]|nr:ATP synthase F1 subunit delta [Bacteroidales bacterium]
MKNILLIRRYAKAFLDYAIKNNMADKGLADLELITKTLQGHRELRNILSQPFLPKAKKEAIVNRIFGDKISDNTLKFITLMLDKNRQDILPNILVIYRDLYNEYKGIAEVTITTAVKIDEPTQQKLLCFVKDKISGNIVIINNIDKNIIGGFIINYLDYQYDRSVRNELKSLQALFNDNLYVKGY